MSEDRVNLPCLGDRYCSEAVRHQQCREHCRKIRIRDLSLVFIVSVLMPQSEETNALAKLDLSWRPSALNFAVFPCGAGCVSPAVTTSYQS